MDLSQEAELQKPILMKHIERQTKILRSLLKSKDADSDDVLYISKLLERSIFTPDDRKNDCEPDPKLNFFPPFLIPECLALHFPFFLNLPIPQSCKSNRSGTSIYENFIKLKNLPVGFCDPDEDIWDDGIGNAPVISELKNNQKFALLESDSTRSRWFKSKALSMSSFAYPSVGLPPILQKLLIEIFIGKPQEPNELSKEYKLSIDDDYIKKYHTDVKKFRNVLMSAVSYTTLLSCIDRFMNRKIVIKNIQESLHYTLCHGFVRLLHILTNCNLSEFVTFHGLTHRNRMNNPFLHTQLDEQDKFDYLLDTIYLFLVFMWQTIMDIWQQTLDDKTINNIKAIFDDKIDDILQSNSSVIVGTKIADIIFPEVMIKAFESNLPDFINQTQLDNFRAFITMKSGVPHSVCPMLPSDVVPLHYNESHPILWSHIKFLKYAMFLLNHGNYTISPTDDLISSCLCECNLCAPHRMPCYNTELLNEIMTINKFEFNGKNDDGTERVIKLTPQTFANSYLTVFVSDDFHYDDVIHFKDNNDSFSRPQACVIKNPKLLALLRETQLRREMELLKRGSGVYLDPDTGEELLAQHIDNVRENVQAIEGGLSEPSYWKGAQCSISRNAKSSQSSGGEFGRGTIGGRGRGVSQR
nr:100K [Tern adenovirus]